MESCPLPVLFITFARPDYARRVFDQIKQAKPKKLYFYSNKARIGELEEINNNETIRSFIQEIDWSCDLRLFFREAHVDVYTSILSALDWVFDNEEEAVILEEDCVPSLAFFDFCCQLLPVYKNDIRIWLISGDNFFPDYNPNGYDYIFSRYAYQYGWATWRSRWLQVKRDNIPWAAMKRYELYRYLFPDQDEADARIEADDRAFGYIQKHPCWDYIFGLTVKANGGFGIIPKTNLVSNIGVSGFHNKGYVKRIHNLGIPVTARYLITNPPLFVVPDYKYDRYFFKKFSSMVVKQSWIAARIKRYYIC